MLRFVLAFFLCSSAFAEIVQFKFTGMKNKQGQIAIAAFNDPDNFPDNHNAAVLTKFVSITKVSDSMVVTVDLPAGHYAIATYLDENMNKKMDKNFFGVPKERFGFSNNPAVQFGPPNFNECEIEVKAQARNQFPINLISLF